MQIQTSKYYVCAYIYTYIHKSIRLTKIRMTVEVEIFIGKFSHPFYHEYYQYQYSCYGSIFFLCFFAAVVFFVTHWTLAYLDLLSGYSRDSIYGKHPNLLSTEIKISLLKFYFHGSSTQLCISTLLYPMPSSFCPSRKDHFTWGGVKKTPLFLVGLFSSIRAFSPRHGREVCKRFAYINTQTIKFIASHIYA